MKVITRKEPPPEFLWVGRWRCTSCESVIEWEPNDANLVDSYESNHQGESLRGHCPVCVTRRWMQRP